MPDNTDYWLEKCSVAVDILATDLGPLRERLDDAWISSLIRLRIHDEVAEDLRQKFSSIERRFDGGLTGMSDQELRDLASDILNLFAKVSRVRQ
jgi:hypothetical protein